MTTTRLLIFSCMLLTMSAQLAQAQQGSQRAHATQPPGSVAGDLMATDEVVSDSMVLPLLGMSDHIEGRLAFLKTELKITPMQLSLWNAFAAAARGECCPGKRDAAAGE